MIFLACPPNRTLGERGPLLLRLTQLGQDIYWHATKNNPITYRRHEAGKRRRFNAGSAKNPGGFSVWSQTAPSRRLTNCGRVSRSPRIITVTAQGGSCQSSARRRGI